MDEKITIKTPQGTFKLSNLSDLSMGLLMDYSDGKLTDEQFGYRALIEIAGAKAEDKIRKLKSSEFNKLMAEWQKKSNVTTGESTPS